MTTLLCLFFCRRPCSFQSVITVVEAHVSLVALLRSDMRLPGVDFRGEWPPQAKRLAKIAWAVAHRVRKAGAAGASSLADDDVMLLCQGAEVLLALADCAGDFFEGHTKRKFAIVAMRVCGEGGGGPALLPSC